MKPATFNGDGHTVIAGKRAPAGILRGQGAD
jgi:hypothetical protein